MISDPPNAIGNCYEAAVDTMVRLCSEGQPSRYRIVHAEIVGQGPIEGLRHGHAFVVDVIDSVAYDDSNGKSLRMPLAFYAHAARMFDVGNWHVYTLDEARERMLKTDVYGPWDLKTSTGF